MASECGYRYTAAISRDKLRRRHQADLNRGSFIRAVKGGGHFLFSTGEMPISGLLRMILITQRTATSSWRARCLP
jgi:hypothetical protein